MRCRRYVTGLCTSCLRTDVGYCDASRLLVRPRSGMLALMVEYDNGEKEWYHIMPRMLESICKRLARKETR